MENRTPKVSIIIIDYGDITWLNQCVATLEYSSDLQILVVNNNKNNRGFALGNNIGAVSAKGKYLLFLNNDTKVAKDFLKPMIEKMESNPKIGICAPRILGYDGEDIEQRVGKSCDIYGWQGWDGPVFFAEGSCLMIRKDLFNRLGGFDEKYFAYLEDMDICWRAQLLGYTIEAVPESIVYHYGGGSSATKSRGRKGSFSTNPFRRYHGEKNQLRSLLKNYETWTLIKIIPRYFLISLCEMGYFLFTLKFDIAFSYAKAYLWNIYNLRDTLKKRMLIQYTRVIGDKEIQSRMVRHSAKIETILKIGLPRK